MADRQRAVSSTAVHLSGFKEVGRFSPEARVLCVVPIEATYPIFNHNTHKHTIYPSRGRNETRQHSALVVGASTCCLEIAVPAEVSGNGLGTSAMRFGAHDRFVAGEFREHVCCF